MNYFTTDLYETKREILKVSKKVSSGLDKPKAKFLSDMIDDSKNYFVIRMQDRRNFFFKGKKKNCHQIAITRKGKIKINVWFEDEEKECYISHTKVTMPFNKKDYELVIVYGLSEEHPMILLTNRPIHSKEDVIKVVRLYFSRWRIEEYFRIKK